MELLKNKYLVTVVCYLLVPLAVWAVLSVPQYPHLGMLVVLAGAVLARLIPNRAVKTLCYLSLGFVSFWAAGNALFVPLGQEAKLFSFLPFVVLGLANGTAAVVAYNDGYVNGIIFASAALVSILFTKGPLDAGGVDRFFLTALIFAAASAVFVLFASWAKGAKWAVYNALKASLVAGAIYGFIYVLRIFDISVLNFSRLNELFAMLSPVLLNIWWASLVSNFFVVALIMGAYELGLYLLDLRRSPHGDVVMFAKAGEAAAVEGDPYAELLSEAEKFFGEFSKYDQARATQILGELEARYSELAKKKESPLKANVGRLLMEARGLLLGARFEITARPAEAERPKRPLKEEKLFEAPEGAAILVEGPIGSRKEEFCMDMLKKRLDAKERCMIVSFEPDREAGYIGGGELLAQVKVEQNINDMALSISRALEEKPKFAFFNVLYYLLPNYNVTTICGFLASTLKKLKGAGATAIFVMEEEMLAQQALSTIESLFDGVVQFATAEEGGKPHSHYRVKELKFRKFDASWREYGGG